MQKYAVAIEGSENHHIHHNLNTRDVVISVYDSENNRDVAGWIDVRIVDENTIIVGLLKTSARVVVIG